ncbi:MAG TPA: hypothetical protein VHL11_09695, partial [Phototrophicaceae bacterium]|nr:hypothetical protein [Phototrophicaceae bacterium]
ETRLVHSFDQGHMISGYGAMAWLYWRTGQPEAALKLAERVTAIVFKSLPTSYYSHPGCVYVTELYLALWEQGTNNEYAAIAQKMCKQLRALARPFPVAAGAAWRCTGHSYQLEGNLDAARSAWQKGLESAQSMGMVYEQALILQHLGNAGDRNYAAQAAMLFDKLGIKMRD